MTATTLQAEFTLTRKYTNRRSPFLWILSYIWRNWILGLLMVAGALANASLAAVAPVLIGQAFNLIINTPDDLSGLLRIALLITGTQVLRGILQLGRNFSAEWMAQRIERDVRDELYISLLGKSMTFHSLQPVGDTMARATNDVREVNFMFNPGLNLVIGSANFMIMPLLLAPRYHPSLVLVPAIFIVGYIVALWQYLHELNPVTADVRRNFGTLNTRLAEALDGVETVKGMVQEESEINRFLENAQRLLRSIIHQGNIESRFVPLLLLALAEAGGFLHAMILFQQGILDVGSVIGYFGLIQLFSFPTFVSLWSYSQISLGLAGARRILELINRENNLDQNLAGYIGPMQGEVTFKNVSFAYQGESLDLCDISFQVKPGQTVAIVGQTGVGKTTLAKLINRTYDCNQGQVMVDHKDVRDWNLETLRQGISIIEQDIFLFSRTVAENIAFGKPGASQEEIEAAAKAAQAHEFILEFKDGYQTVIGERGVTLSGGQRQRIALARAFLTDPRILILDDSTSSIDSATEDKIQQAIYAASRGRTTFLITHRLSQIRWADLILVLRQGQIAAIGTHDDLMRTSQAYRNIFSE
jgi:ATP-binding cassette subfamily B protein